MAKAVRVATICHALDDHRDPAHRRVRLQLVRVMDDDGRAYEWQDDQGDATAAGSHATVYDALCAAIQTWGAPEWDLKAKWLY